MGFLMSRSSSLPPLDELVRLRDSGLSQAQIAARFNVSRSAVSLAFVRGNETTQRPRYVDALPWSPIKPEHNNQYPRTMLRMWARRESGETLSVSQSQRLESFERSLRQADEVITYEPDGGGFVRVKARIGVDTGLIRKP